MTTYIVLKGDDDGWSIQNPEVEASSSQEAIRRAVTDSGSYIAVPLRSWKSVRVQAVATTVLKLERS